MTSTNPRFVLKVFIALNIKSTIKVVPVPKDIQESKQDGGCFHGYNHNKDHMTKTPSEGMVTSYIRICQSYYWSFKIANREKTGIKVNDFLTSSLGSWSLNSSIFVSVS